MAVKGKSEAVVLQTHELRECDLIVVFLTRESGKLRGVARGARGGKVKRFGGALLPGTVIHLDWQDSGRSELVRVNECSIVRSYFNDASTDLRLSFHQAYFLELAEGFTVQQDPQDDLYRLLRICLEQAVGAGERLITVRRYFEFWLLRLSGLFPRLTHCSQCGARHSGRSTNWLHPGEGFLCPACSRVGPARWRLTVAAATRLTQFARLPLELALQETTTEQLRIDRDSESLITGMLQHHLGRQIRSLAYLETMK